MIPFGPAIVIVPCFCPSVFPALTFVDVSTLVHTSMDGPLCADILLVFPFFIVVVYVELSGYLLITSFFPLAFPILLRIPVEDPC